MLHIDCLKNKDWQELIRNLIIFLNRLHHAETQFNYTKPDTLNFKTTFSISLKLNDSSLNSP